jgi:hypothetical protein
MTLDESIQQFADELAPRQMDPGGILGGTLPFADDRSPRCCSVAVKGSIPFTRDLLRNAKPSRREVSFRNRANTKSRGLTPTASEETADRRRPRQRPLGRCRQPAVHWNGRRH